MRRFKYTEPGDNGEVLHIVKTEAEILWEYWFYWSEQMRQLGKDSEISIQTCIRDWVVNNWADEL
jgi:hypothetical protein